MSYSNRDTSLWDLSMMTLVVEVYHCYQLFIILNGITGSSDKLLQYPMTLHKGPKDPYLPSLISMYSKKLWCLQLLNLTNSETYTKIKFFGYSLQLLCHSWSLNIFFDGIIIGLKKGLVTNMFFFTIKNDNSARLTIFLIDKYMRLQFWCICLWRDRWLHMIFIQYVHRY